MKRAARELDSPCSKRLQEASCSHSSTAPLCGYHGCDRLCFPKARGMYYEFCGITHADMYMAEASDSAEYDIIMADYGPCGDKKCRLPGCQKLVAKSVAREHDFCSISHMLEYTTLSTAKYQKLGKMCKIEHCFRHVYVENGRSHDFCGLKHAKLAAAAKGVRVKITRSEESAEEMNSNSDQDQESGNHRQNFAPEHQQEHQEVGKSRLLAADEFGHTGFDGGISNTQLEDYLMACQAKLLEEPAQGKSSNMSPRLIDIFQGADGHKFLNTNIFQGADESKLHPWEILTEPKPRYLLAIRGKTKVARKTRDGGFWKQTGRPYLKLRGLMCKYFIYKEKRGESLKEQKRGSWSLHEYSLERELSRVLATQKGVGKSDRILKPVILKIFRGDDSRTSRGDEDGAVSQVTSKFSSTTDMHGGRSGNEEFGFTELCRAVSGHAFYDTFEFDDGLCPPQTDTDLWQPEVPSPTWDFIEPEADW